MIRKLMCVAAVVLAAELSSALEWMHDLAAAGKRAADEQKLLLVEFSGSDWCKHCIAQKKKVLDTPVFEEWVQEHCVPVEVDVPHNAHLVGGEERKRRNAAICEDFGVKSFPTLKVLTPDLVMVGGYSGAMQNPQSAIALLERAFPAADRLLAAQALCGDARAAALADIYRQIPEAERAFHYPLLKLIGENDVNNVSGLVPEYCRVSQMRLLRRDMAAAATGESRIACVEKALQSPIDGNEPELRRILGQTMREHALLMAREAKSVQDILTAKKLMLDSLQYVDRAREAEQFRLFIDAYFANPESMLRRRNGVQ